MSSLKTVGVRELKNSLSAYLREVRRGVRILVSDRNAVVAELHEPGAHYTVSASEDPIVAAWTEQGVVIPPSHPRTPVPPSPVRVPAGTAARLLDAGRG